MLHRARKQLRGHLTGWWNDGSNRTNARTLSVFDLRMLKISKAEPVNHAVLLRLEGRVVGPWVTELQKSMRGGADRRPIAELQLTDVEFMDAQGVALLSSLRSRGVVLLECPPFAAEQLKTNGRS